MTSDLLSNMFTKIRNAIKIKKPYVEVPYSENNYKIAKLLQKQGFLNGATFDSISKYDVRGYFDPSNQNDEGITRTFVYDHETIFREKQFEKNNDRKINLEELLFLPQSNLSNNNDIKKTPSRFDSQNVSLETDHKSTEGPKGGHLRSLIPTSEQDIINQNIIKNEASTKDKTKPSVTAKELKENTLDNSFTLEPETKESGESSLNDITNNNSEKLTDSNVQTKLKATNITNNDLKDSNNLSSSTQIESSQNSEQNEGVFNNQDITSSVSTESLSASLEKKKLSFTMQNYKKLLSSTFVKQSFFLKTICNFYYLKTKQNYYEHSYQNLHTSFFQRRKKIIIIALKFKNSDKQSVIHSLKRISKSSLRRYCPHPIPTVLNGLGIAIISTSLGIMTDNDARIQKVGGEILAEIW